MKLTKGKIVVSIPIFIMLISLIFLIASVFTSNEEVLTGIVETTEIDVASKIPGRIDTIYVNEGEHIDKGSVLASLESKEMDAKVEQAKGAMEAAKAKLQMAKNGARPEEKIAVEQLYIQAKEQFNYVEKTWIRFKKLFKDSVITKQEMDEMQFKYNSAKAQMEAAKAKYEMVMKGARPEEIDAAESLYHQAENAFNEACAYKDELIIKSPIDGEVSKIIANTGEVINSGYPIFTILDLRNSYVVLQVREDKMDTIKMGKIFKGFVPALNNSEYEFEVTYISPMADFATWKPTNQKGEFDLKTFEIHLRSKSPINNLRPGMTVNIKM
ncbi:HlyD family secretion protein [Melioribacteraceae bacterium 4301-Me]|uniref:HlyD family secretion protein n=1 Tax=Pyranulibacter aquaticus TaxID=3163344 RepID=UPI00359B0A76